MEKEVNAEDVGSSPGSGGKVVPAPGGGGEYSIGRRGSSPAVLSGIAPPRYDPYFDNSRPLPPLHPSFGNVGPMRQQPPYLSAHPHQPHHQHPSFPPPSHPPFHLSTPPFHHQQTGASLDLHNPSESISSSTSYHHNMRRYSLPATAYTQSLHGGGSGGTGNPWSRSSTDDVPRYPPAGSGSGSGPDSTSHSSSNSISGLYAPPNEFNSMVHDLVSPTTSSQSPEFGFGTVGGDEGSGGNGDYSPDSSADDQHTPFDGSVIPLGGVGAGFEGAGAPLVMPYTFGSATRFPATTMQDDNESVVSYGPGGEYLDAMGLSSGMGMGRRSSCPAGFIPQFDSLGVSSPPSHSSVVPHPPSHNGQPLWTASYRPEYDPHHQLHHPTEHSISPLAGMQKRHSVAVPPSYHPVSPFALSSPTQAPAPSPYYTSPQFHHAALNGRRGSTSSTVPLQLGTIVEALSPQPGSATSGTFPSSAQTVPSPTTVEGGTDVFQGGQARKSRSQASLRTAAASPYSTQERRGSIHQERERRGSLPGVPVAVVAGQEEGTGSPILQAQPQTQNGWPTGPQASLQIVEQQP
ncbi:hypothetical protein T439DRAFT_67757 [Meredithblackwellia eburnea MCA 4105]